MAGIVLALAGCAAPASAPTAGAATTPGGATPGLYVGMTPQAVRATFGEPLRIEATGLQATWTYERGRSTSTTQIAASTKEVPYVDPITGELLKIIEPDQSLETTTLIEELRLFWDNDQLIGWRTEFRRVRELQ